MPDDIFTDENGQPRVLYGCAICTASPRLAELASRVGFDVIWVEMEHATTDLAGSEAICVSIDAGGAVPLVRTGGWRREHILQALEIGGRIIVVPMINDEQMARDVVRFGKFPPLGARGFNSLSRALDYGLGFPDTMHRANDATVLLPQIETLEAVENLDAILSVEGLGGVFLGPGDLSAALGRPGDMANPELHKLVRDCIARTRAAGLHAAIFCGSGPLLQVALEAGADLCIASSDLGVLAKTWQEQIAEFKA